MLCEEGMTIAKARSALLIPQSINKQYQQKHKMIQGRLTNIA
jgi:hypothetical protein